MEIQERRVIMSTTPGAGAVIAILEALRHEFARLPITVKAVADGDERRAAVVARHVAFVCTWLEAQSIDGDDAELAGDLAGIRALADAWSSAPGHQERASLHTALIETERRVLRHLAVEEQAVLALDEAEVAARSTEVVARNLADRATGDATQLRIGFVLNDATQAHADEFRAALPAELGAQWEVTGKAQYTAYRAELTDY